MNVSSMDEKIKQKVKSEEVVDIRPFNAIYQVFFVYIRKSELIKNLIKAT